MEFVVHDIAYRFNITVQYGIKALCGVPFSLSKNPETGSRIGVKIII